ncbi:MAG: zf-HC2 domain-containing protein [Myxococcales bacterium]|nr:zf-HC2 domain-containing protein [Myxococcota bacterium]MDW8281169.1 zf-HC2 domain-containing protein [Myxococcales bacterium]
MRQHCPYDDKLLDALYGELSAEEEAVFRAHLAGCVQCRVTQQRFLQVRDAFRALPAPHVAEDILERMTAQILQQAQLPLQGQQPSQMAGSTREAPDAGVGKLLPLRRRGLRGVVFHPATGIVAAAAMALLFVVARGWDRGPIFPVADRLPPPPRISQAPGRIAQVEASREAPAPAPSSVGEDRVASLALRREAAQQRTAASPPGGQQRVAEVARGKAARPHAGQTAKTDLVGPEGLVIRGPAQPTMAAVPPPAESWLHSTTPADGEVAGSAPAEPAGMQMRRTLASSPSPPQTKGTQGFQHRQMPSEAMEAGESLRQHLDIQQRDDVQRALGRFGPGSGKAVADGQLQQLLRRLRDHLRQGQCREAAAIQRQMAQLGPGFEISAEDQATMARVCPAGQNATDPASAAQQVDRGALPKGDPKRGPAPPASRAPSWTDSAAPAPAKTQHDR